MDLAQLAINALVIVATAGACYGAIRADIRHLVTGVGEAKSIAAQAHQRIDRLLERQLEP